jgi:DNA-binding NarL/FixJ family response regulator
MKSVLILEDTADVRDWLARLIERAFPGIVVSAVALLAQAQAAIRTATFDLALVDINLPDGNGVTLVDELRARSPATYCVMATVFDDDDNVFQALRAGSHGYLLKGDPEHELVARLNGILRGEPPLSPSIARRVLGYFSQPQVKRADGTSLTDREREVLILIAKGLNRPEIGELLGIGSSTVATHIGAVYRKLDISSRPEATIEAMRMGLLRP